MASGCFQKIIQKYKSYVKYKCAKKKYEKINV